MRKKKNIIIFLVILIIAGLLLAPRFETALTRKKEAEEYNRQLKETGKSWGLDDKTFESNLASKKSDIEGWTQLDKYNHGLDFHDGSDTDADGLTDKQEIEEYGSDPLKKSTAGDFYTDSYKVANGLDLHSPIPYNKVPKLENNKCPEVLFTVETADDLSASATEVTKTLYDEMLSDLFPWTDNYKVYKAYWIRGYDRDSLSIDITNLGIDDKYTVVAGYVGRDVKKADFSENGNIVTIKYPFDDDVVVAFVKKSSQFSFNSATSIQKNGSKSYQEPKALVSNFEILTILPFYQPQIYYVKGTDDYETKLMLVETGTAVSFSCGRSPEDYGGLKMSDFKEISIDDYERKLAERRKRFPDREFSPYSDKQTDFEHVLKGLTFRYYTYDEIKGFSPKDIYDWYPDINELRAKAGKPTKNPSEDLSSIITPGKNGYIEMKLDITDATLPFSNFGSYISEGGNCAGISHLTALLYNSGTNYQTGTSEIKGLGTVSWDLTTDPENRTLMDRGLSDYKDSRFVINHVSKGIIMDKDLSPGEQEFVKMIGCFWAKGNELTPDDKYVKVSRKTNISYQLINKAKRYINEGKMLDLYIGSGTEGHAVNIYGYRDGTTPDGVEMTEFLIYDNNWPDDKTPTGTSVNTVLKVFRTKSEYGYPDSFSFYYNPLGQIDTMITDVGSGRYCFIVLDDSWERLNDIVEKEVLNYQPYEGQ